MHPPPTRIIRTWGWTTAVPPPPVNEWSRWSIPAQMPYHHKVSVIVHIAGVSTISLLMRRWWQMRWLSGSKGVPRDSHHREGVETSMTTSAPYFYTLGPGLPEVPLLQHLEHIPMKPIPTKMSNLLDRSVYQCTALALALIWRGRCGSDRAGAFDGWEGYVGRRVGYKCRAGA